MIERYQLVAAMRKEQLIFVLPRENAETTARQIRILIAEGRTAFGIPVDLPEAVDRVAAAASASKGGALIGAVGVTDSNTARAAIASGADFISMPYLDEKSVRLCHRYGKVCIPGALSVTEVLQAVESACDLVGLYPAQLFGPKLLQAIKGPLPQAHLVPSGDIAMQAAADWIRAGAAAVQVRYGKG